jgi:hypothetical protein
MTVHSAPTAAEQAVLDLMGPVLLELARREFKDFCFFVKIPESGTGMVPLEMWPHIIEAIETLSLNKLIVWAKSRQIGITTILAAYSIWHAMFTPRALVVIFSRNQQQSYAFLQKARDIYLDLPDELRIGLTTPDNREQMSFVNGSEILAFPSTIDAARGLTPTLVIMDEADYHEYIEAGYASVRPGISNNQGQMIITSTVNAYKMGSFFQRLYQDSPGNGFTRLFFGWRVHPGRSDVWYAEEKRGYQDQALFQKEFPETAEEAFAPARAIAAFDLDVLAAMKKRCMAPIEVLTLGNGVRANIYQEFQPGVRYAAATDTSHGTGQDYAVTVILDTINGCTVAEIMSNVINGPQLAVASVELLNAYDAPIWGIEDNDWGITTITEAQNLRYKRIYHQEKGVPGWHTWDAQGHPKGSRFQIWGDLIEAINHRRLTIFSESALSQFTTVIRNPDKNGRIEAQQGAHDDYPMALCIAYQLRNMSRPAAGERGKKERRIEVGEGGVGEIPFRERMRQWADWR